MTVSPPGSGCGGNLLREGNEKDTGYADRARAEREHGFERKQTRN